MFKISKTKIFGEELAECRSSKKFKQSKNLSTSRRNRQVSSRKITKDREIKEKLMQR
jgi:hypothetical protein